MRDRQTALQQIEVQGLDPKHSGQLVANQPFLGRAVHLRDEQHRAHLLGWKGKTLGLHADGAQSGFDRLQRVELVVHRQRALHQVEL
ncbi:hypothetical protein D3C81_2066430 [compost metagenome]